MKYFYYAIFKKDEQNPEYINVTFPDIVPGVTFGDSFEDAVYMAKDLLKLMLKEAPQQCFPPTSLEKLKEEYPDETFVLIDVEL